MFDERDPRRHLPDGYGDFKSVESADFGVTHVGASESRREAPVLAEDEHKLCRRFEIYEEAGKVVANPGFAVRMARALVKLAAGKSYSCISANALMMVELNNEMSVLSCARNIAKGQRCSRCCAAFCKGSKPNGGNPPSRGSVHESPTGRLAGCGQSL